MNGSSSLEDWRNIATIVGASAACVAAVFASVTAVQAFYTLRLKSITDMFELLDGKEGSIRRARQNLREAVNTNRPITTEHLKENRGLADDVNTVIRAYDKVGLMVKLRVIPCNLLFDFYSRPILEAWNATRQYIEEGRIAKRQPGHMLKFQTLAVGAALSRIEKYPGDEPAQQTVRMADVGDRSRWDEWRVRNLPLYTRDDASSIATRLGN